MLGDEAITRPPHLLLQTVAGTAYRARACGRQRDDDGLWEDWIAFEPDNRSAPLRTPRETTQPTLAALEYWAAPVPRLLTEFQSGMRDLGYAEGATYTLLERYAEAKVERLPGLAAELVWTC